MASPGGVSMAEAVHDRPTRNIKYSIAIILVVFAALFIFTEMSSGADGVTWTFSPNPDNNGNLTVNDVDCSDDSSKYYKVTKNGNNQRITIPDLNPSDGYEYFPDEGYYFSGWNSRANGNGTSYTVGDTVNMGRSNATIYAIWKPYTITFDKNGGTSPRNNYTTNVNDLTVPGSTITSGYSTYNYVNGSYVLVGWSEVKPSVPTTEAPQYRPGEILPIPTDSYPLYAVWKQRVTVTFDPNGGDSPTYGHYYSASTADMTVPENVFTVNNTTYSYLRSGYTFMGWSTDSSSSTAEYAPGDILVTGSSNITLYAVWAEGVKIVFDPNGGDTPADVSGYYSPLVVGVLYVPGSAFTVDGISYSYTRAGYTFLGWSTDRNASSPEYVRGNLLPAPADDTGYVLYAIWKINSNKVTFVYDDNHSIDVEIEYGYTFDSSAYMKAPSDIQNMDAYKIVGWSRTKVTSCEKVGGAYVLPSTAQTFSKKISLPSEEDLIVYAIWALKTSVPESGALTFTSNHRGCYYINSDAAANGIVVDGASSGTLRLFIDGVSLDYTDKDSSEYSPFVLKNGADVILTVMGNSSFTGASDVPSSTSRYIIGYAGINVQAGTKLTIAEDSLGKLTAQGGSAKSYYRYGNTNQSYDGRAGAGIGANGNASETPYDAGCGVIVINGGIIVAYGGDGGIDLSRGYQNTDWWTGKVTSLGGDVNTDVVAAQGIGGTTDSSATDNQIIINKGRVTVATGHISAFNSQYDNLLVSENDGTFQDPIYDGSSGGARTLISSNATVITVSKDGADINLGDYDTLYFDSVVENGTQVTIGSALSVTIDGDIVIDVGGMSIEQGSQLFIEPGLIADGSSVRLLTEGKHFFIGQATAQQTEGLYYITLTLTDDEPRGSVYVYSYFENVDSEVTGTEIFGSISPYPSVTVSSSSSTMTYQFTVSLNEGYECLGVRVGTPEKQGDILLSVDFVDHDLISGVESVVRNGNTYVYTLQLTLGTTGTGVENYFSFKIGKTLVPIIIWNTYSENEDIIYPSTIVDNPAGIDWDDWDTEGTYTKGTGTHSAGRQYVYYKESMTYTINVTMGGGNDNPLIVKWITVDGRPWTVEYNSVSNRGVYSFTVNDISAQTVVEIRYAPTVKISSYPTFVEGSNSDIVIYGTDSQGNDGFYLRSGTGTMESFVEKGTMAYFRAIYGHYVDQEWVPYTIKGSAVGITSITVTSANSAYSRTITPSTDHEKIYAIGILSADTEINVRFTIVTWDLIFSSRASETEYEFVSGTTFDIEIVSDQSFADIIENRFALLDADGHSISGLTVTASDISDATLIDGNYHASFKLTLTGSYDGAITIVNSGGVYFYARMVESVSSTAYVIQYSQYKITVVDQTYYQMPTEDMFESLGLQNKIGYDLEKWYIVRYDGNKPPANMIGTPYKINPGDTIQATCKMVLIVQWCIDPHEYSIGYDIDEAYLCEPVRTSYNVESDTFTLGLAERDGFEFLGWITEGQSAGDASLVVEIEKGSIGDRYFISVWEGEEVEFTLRDPKSHIDETTKEFTIGSPFGDLPLYSTWTLGDKKYTFVGWSLVDYTLPGASPVRISETDIVEYNESGYNIYIIWVDSDLYIVNIETTVGGSVSAAVYGTPGSPIILIIDADPYYKATTVIVSPAGGTTRSYAISPTEYPFTYPVPTNEGSAFYGVMFFNIKVIFERIPGIPIPYPVANNYTYDGTVKIGLSDGTGYTVSGALSGTNAGDYVVLVELLEGYLWEGSGTVDDIEITWVINKRIAYIIAESSSMRYSESGFDVPDNAYKTLCIVPEDIGDGEGKLNISTKVLQDGVFVDNIQSEGSYINAVYYSGYTSNYDIRIINGTYIIFADESSTVVVALVQGSNANSQNSGNSSSGESSLTNSASMLNSNAVQAAFSPQVNIRRGRI